jgi:type IV conjugative transfer system protein TraL
MATNISLEEYRIPVYLDAPNKFLFWDFDTAMAGGIPLIVGLMIPNILLAIAGPFAGYYYAQMKMTIGTEFLVQAVCWYFPMNGVIGGKVKNYVREYIG